MTKEWGIFQHEFNLGDKNLRLNQSITELPTEGEIVSVLLAKAVLEVGEKRLVASRWIEWRRRVEEEQIITPNEVALVLALGRFLVQCNEEGTITSVSARTKFNLEGQEHWGLISYDPALSTMGVVNKSFWPMNGPEGDKQVMESVRKFEPATSDDMQTKRALHHPVDDTILLDISDDSEGWVEIYIREEGSWLFDFHFDVQIEELVTCLREPGEMFKNDAYLLADIIEGYQDLFIPVSGQ